MEGHKKGNIVSVITYLRLLTWNANKAAGSLYVFEMILFAVF